MEAVTFDFWNTVMWEEPGSLRTERLAFWSERLNGRAELSPAWLEQVHDAAHRAYEEAWRANRQFRVPDAVGQIVRELEDGGDPHLREVLTEGFSAAGHRAAIHPSDGISDCLDALRGAGMRTAIVCDIGLTPSSVVRQLLEREGLLDRFDACAFSDEVGFYKPAREIFEYALTSVDTAPSAAAHIGDRRRTDVGGALAMGMTAIRYNGAYEDGGSHEPEAPHVISRLTDLPRLVGATG